MRRSTTNITKYITAVIILLLVSVIIASLYQIFAVEESTEEIGISVIVNDNNNSRWTAFQLGLERAAKENKVDLTIVPTGRFESDDDIWNLVDQKVEDKTEGIILTPYSAEGFNDLAEKLTVDTKLAFVESDMKIEDTTVYQPVSVTPNYKDMAKCIVEDIEEDIPDLENYKVYILAATPDQLGTEDGVSYIKSKLAEQNCIIQNVIDTTKDQDHNYLKNGQADILIAMDEYSMSMAAKGLGAKKKNTVALYGIGNSETSVYYLEHNIIRSMIVVNEYKMGYLSLKYLAEAIRNHSQEATKVEIDYLHVRPEYVHEPDIEKILYPNIQ